MLYGSGEKTLEICLESKSFEYIVHKHGSSAFVLDLKLSGQEDRDLKAIIKELQRDPITSRIMHVDLQHISMTQMIEVDVPIHLLGTPAGVKEGGILEQILREVEVSCQAAQIPERVDFEVSHLQKGNSVHVRDLVLPEGVKVITPADRVVATDRDEGDRGRSGGRPGGCGGGGSGRGEGQGEGRGEAGKAGEGFTQVVDRRWRFDAWPGWGIPVRAMSGRGTMPGSGWSTGIARERGFSWRRIGGGHEAAGEVLGRKITLLRPGGYMNRSGEPVLDCMQRNSLFPEEILVVVDDVALPPGRLRLREGGSSGGHRGMASIEEALGTMQYPRLRIGVGGAEPEEDLADFVLRPLAAEERAMFDEIAEKGADAVRLVLSAGLTQAMNRINPSPREDGGAPAGPSENRSEGN